MAALWKVQDLQQPWRLSKSFTVSRYPSKYTLTYIHCIYSWELASTSLRLLRTIDRPYPSPYTYVLIYILYTYIRCKTPGWLGGWLDDWRLAGPVIGNNDCRKVICRRRRILNYYDEFTCRPHGVRVVSFQSMKHSFGPTPKYGKLFVHTLRTKY